MESLTVGLKRRDVEAGYQALGQNTGEHRGRFVLNMHDPGETAHLPLDQRRHVRPLQVAPGARDGISVRIVTRVAHLDVKAVYLLGAEVVLLSFGQRVDVLKGGPNFIDKVALPDPVRADDLGARRLAGRGRPEPLPVTRARRARSMAAIRLNGPPASQTQRTQDSGVAGVSRCCGS